MNKHIRILILFFIALSFFNTNIYAQKRKSSPINVDSLFTQAQIAFTIEKYEEAFEMFQEIVKIQPDNAVANAQLAHLYFAQEDYSRSLTHIQNAIKNDPENTDYLENQAEIMVNLGRIEEAAVLYEQLADQGISPTENYIHAVIYYKSSENYEKALAVLDILEEMNIEGEQESIAMEKLTIYISLNENEKALEYIQEIIKEGKPQYHVILALYYKYVEDHENVRKTIDEAIQLYPNEAFIVQMAMKFYVELNDTMAIKNFLVNVRSMENLGEDEKLYAYMPLIEASKGNPHWEEFVNTEMEKLTQMEDAGVEVFVLDGYVKALDGLVEESLESYQKANQIDKKDERPWILIFEHYINNQQNDSAIYLFDEAIFHIPDHPLFYYYKGLALLYNEKSEEAIEVLTKGESMIKNVNPEEMQARFYYILGLIYQQNKNFERTEYYYNQYLEINQEDVSILNNYSYLLAEENKDLEMAYQMSAYVIQKHPQNSMYLDTHAWVLYRMGEYIQAKHYMERAIKNAENEEPVYFEHLGDIEYELGNKRKAGNLWKKAKKLGSDSEDLDEKIKNK